MKGNGWGYAKASAKGYPKNSGNVLPNSKGMKHCPSGDGSGSESKKRFKSGTKK